MYQPLGLISIHFFLRRFLFRIKFWIAWFLSRGSNEELAMMLQNAVLSRWILPSAHSLCRSRSPFVLHPLALFASPKTSWVFSQLSSLLVAQRNASWKERNALWILMRLKRNWSCSYTNCVMNYFIVIASLERWNQASNLNTNCFLFWMYHLLNAQYSIYYIQFYIPFLH